jgi:hypothetical protein
VVVLGAERHGIREGEVFDGGRDGVVRGIVLVLDKNGSGWISASLWFHFAGT